MQRTAFTMATALVTATPAALAGGGGFQDYARVTGVEPQYEYRGYAYTTVLPYDPGPTLPVTVTVSPAPDRLARYSGWNGGYPRE